MADIGFSKEQITSVVDLATYRKFIASDLSDTASDVALVRAWEQRIAHPRTLADDNVVKVIADDAMITIMEFITMVLRGGINTTELLQWVALRESLIAANRLVVLGDVPMPDGLSMRELLVTISMLTDIYTRAADKRLRQTATPDGSLQKQQSKFASVYLDLICGRVSAWLSYIDFICLEICTLHKQPWPELKSYYNAVSYDHMRSIVMAKCGVDERRATELVVEQALLLGTLYASFQQGVYGADVKKTDDVLTDDLGACFHMDLVEIFGPYIADVQPPMGADMVGYDAFFEIDPISTIVPLSDEMSLVTRVRLCEAHGLHV